MTDGVCIQGIYIKWSIYICKYHQQLIHGMREIRVRKCKLWRECCVALLLSGPGVVKRSVPGIVGTMRVWGRVRIEGWEEVMGAVVKGFCVEYKMFWGCK